ncbi:MAG TPA: thiamine phosphate synthase [Candidatus Acidoferrales bacterium]|nr:thiamine phosphate synthase [Candidatus Acidoferrales bacterium]
MRLVFPRLYAIIDAGLLKTSELAFAEMMAESGVELIQYRNKKSPARYLFEIAHNLAQFLNPRGVRFIVNDRADVAALVGAGGVHVGQEDLGVEEARAIGRSSQWVGISTHTLEQVERANKSSANYIAVGPIYATRTKENPDLVVGTEFIGRARLLTGKPLVAIGGITLERAWEVFRAGADSVAVARDLICAQDPCARARALLKVAAEVSSTAGGKGASHV